MTPEQFISENLKIHPLVKISILEGKSIYPGPNLDCTPIDHGKVEEIFILNSEFQNTPGFIVLRCKDKHGSLLGFMPVADRVRDEIIKSIDKLEKIIQNVNSTPNSKTLSNSALPITIYIGDVLNPELLLMPTK